jgi:aspartyl-tRNA synthetase
MLAMERTLIKDLPGAVGERVVLKGWVDTRRDHGKLTFFDLRDRSGKVQMVVLAKSGAKEIAEKLRPEWVVKVVGQVNARPEAMVNKEEPNGTIELTVDELEVLSEAATPPIPVISNGYEDEANAHLRLDYRWIDLRPEAKRRIFEVWTELEKGFRAAWLEQGFIQVYPPALMSTPSESGAEVFAVDYFGRRAYLAQSPQFYKQMAMAAGFERVFMVGPVFRAEPSFTTRHLTEFTGWDFEMSFINSHHDVMDLEESLIVAGFEAVAAKFPDLGLVAPRRPFPRLPMVEAKKILAGLGVASPEEHDLSPEEERALSEFIKKEQGHDFVFVTDYHKSKSAFYHMRHENDNDRSKRADLLFRGIEVTTLAQREHRPEILEKQAKEKGMSLESLKDYLNFFRYGCPPHGGAGIGPGRLIMKILDLPNVREATYLPRDVKRLNP